MGQIVNTRVHNLDWSHIRRVLSVSNPDARLWYLENAYRRRTKKRNKATKRILYRTEQEQVIF